MGQLFIFQASPAAKNNGLAYLQDSVGYPSKFGWIGEIRIFHRSLVALIIIHAYNIVKKNGFILNPVLVRCLLLFLKLLSNIIHRVK